MLAEREPRVKAEYKNSIVQHSDVKPSGGEAAHEAGGEGAFR